jgi:hypothetical protein
VIGSTKKAEHERIRLPRAARTACGSKKEYVMKTPTALIQKVIGTDRYTLQRASVRKLLASSLFVIASLSAAFAQIAECPLGKLSDYEKLSPAGCQIGDKRFFNFQYHQGTGGLPSAAISVTPGTIPITNDPGILLEGKWAAASRDSYVSYIVATMPKGKPIKGASLEMQFGQITGSGKASVIADLCAADEAELTCGAQRMKLQVVLSADGKRKATDTAQFSQPQIEIRVTTPVDVSPGKGGNVELGGFMTIFQ